PAPSDCERHACICVGRENGTVGGVLNAKSPAGLPPGSTDLRSQGRYGMRSARSVAPGKKIPNRATWVMKPPLALAVRSGFRSSPAGNGTYPLSCLVRVLLVATTTNRTTGEDQLEQSLPEAESRSQDQPV